MSGRGERGGGGVNEPAHQRYSNLIHDSEVFLAKLREFKPQSLGCLEARRKSSSTLIFPNPQQACMGPSKCPRYPHHIKPTPGYWIECHGPGSQAASTGVATTAAGSQHQTPGRKLAEHHREGSFDATTGDSRPISRQDIAQHHQPLQPAPGGLTKTTVSSSQDDLDHLYRHATVSSGTHIVRSGRFEQVGDEQTGTGVTRPTRDTVVGQAATVESAAASQQAASDARKRLNKRTMTRDDIDLHKPRRTPNITITEPSFSQATTVAFYGATGSRRPLKSQTSQDQTANLGGQQSAPPAPPPPPLPPPPLPVEHVKLQIQGCQSIEAHELSLDDDSEPSNDDFLLYRLHHQHRPSVIREFSDQEEHEAAKEVQEQLESHKKVESAEDKREDREEPSVAEKQLYSGLSTDTFQKRPYQVEQQAYLEQQAALAAEINMSPSGLEQPSRSHELGNLELISFGEENYEKHYYGREHWNYFTNDELLGPVMLSLKQEVNNQRDHFHVLLRTVSYTLHGTIPASTICADRYDREAIVRELSEIAKLKPPLMLGQLPSTPDELLKLDHIFIKTELKVGVINIREGQAESEEAILGNKEESPLFTEFLELLGDRITLKGFDRYKGGLDTVHNLTGTESVYTMWRNIEIMFHVSTMLPHEENDPQKLQKKRHIGNDIVCVAFIESDDTLFWPGCIKSYFLHTFITVRTSPKPLKEGEKRKYLVSCVCRNEVQYAFKPFLIEEDEFFKSDFFREWLLVKIVNGERASYSAPKFARMQDRTRSQLLEDIITNLANHLVTGQIPKPYRRGSWRPLGHTRASSPLEDSMKDYFEDYDQLAKDFCQAFCGPSRSMLCDVVFKVKDRDGSQKLVHGVRAIMAIRSRTFLEMLYGFVPPGTGPTNLQNQTSLRAIEIKALSGESSAGSKEAVEHTKSLLAKRGSVGADPGKKMGEKERRQSMLPNLSKSIVQKPNYLTVPMASSGGGPGVPGGSGTGGMIKNAFNRLVSGNWSGWSGNIKGYKGEAMRIKVDQNKTKVDLNSLAICKEIAKIDAEKLAQREFEIKEFDYDIFQQTVEYIHNGQCKLSYETIPGLICAAEHYDLPDLLHACFHHANTHMKLAAAPKMMNALYQSSCFYVTAMQLLDSIYEYIDPLATEFFSRTEYYELNESVFTALLCRKSLQISELMKFQAMDGWARQQILNKQQQKLLQLQQQRILQRQQSAELDRLSTWDSGSESKLIEPLAGTVSREELDADYRSLMIRLNKEVNIKLDKISSDDLVKIVLPTKVFNNDKVFEIMSHDLRMDY